MIILESISVATEKRMQSAFWKYYYSNFDLIAHNTHPTWRYNEMDLMGIRASGYVDEFEIKLSRSDFRADFKKVIQIESPLRGMYKKYIDINKHSAIEKGLAICNRFSFYLPEELAKIVCIPKYAGLIVLTNRDYIKVIKKAPLLHKNKISLEMKYAIARKIHFRYWQLNKEKT